MLEILHTLYKNPRAAGNTAMLLRFDDGVPKDIADPNRVFQSFGANVAYRDNIKKFGSHSLYVGASSRLQVPDSAELRMGLGDFTVEMFVYHVTIAVNTCIFAKSNSNMQSSFLTFGSGGNQMGITSDNGISSYANMSLVPTGAWTHWALVCRARKWSLFRNGVAIFNQVTNVGTFAENASPFSLGGFSYSANSASNSNAYFDEIRVSNVARYGPGSFTVPTERFVLD